MKPIFKCDYCEKMGIEEEIADHEHECQKNPSKRTCLTCGNATGVVQIKCSLGREIPAMKCIVNCQDYVPGGNPEDKVLKSFSNIFGNPFAW